MVDIDDFKIGLLPSVFVILNVLFEYSETDFILEL